MSNSNFDEGFKLMVAISAAFKRFIPYLDFNMDPKCHASSLCKIQVTKTDVKFELPGSSPTISLEIFQKFRCFSSLSASDKWRKLRVRQHKMFEERLINEKKYLKLFIHFFKYQAPHCNKISVKERRISSRHNNR